MKPFRYLLVLFCVVFTIHRASAQYYTWGSDAPMKWSTIRTANVRMIFPDTVTGVAQRTLFYIRAVRPSISYGFDRGPMRIPFVMHPENFQSNGLVMYLPKRVEFLTSPAIDGYSMPWYKQLVAHEYRHTVQYNNLNVGITRVLSYLLGQQGSTIGLLFMPIWAMEGDATMSETQMSTFGRGLQPSFTMGYRAMEPIAHSRKNIDKWFSGSYLEYIPDHYELGYQICSYAYDRFDENVWNKLVRYSARNIYVLATTHVAMSKYYNTNVQQLFRETFDDLEQHWASLPEQKDSAVPVTELPERNYTTYQWPMPLDDTTALVLKTDYDRPARFVRVDTRTGEECVVAYTGSISSRPALGNGRVWWTEYRRSKLFEQRVNSQLCFMNLADGITRTYPCQRDALYPTSAGDDLAWVEYDPSGRYSVAVHGPDGDRRYAVPDAKEIHGLAWDAQTGAYYVLVTDDEGMWIGRIGADGLQSVTAAAYITLSDLRAADGKLYFGSIASGRDEVHCYDLAAGREYRVTTSAYGSFDAGPARSGSDMLVTTYDKRGYGVARQPLADSSLIAVAPSRLPLNLVNPPRKKWDVVNLDTVRFTAADSVAQNDSYRTKRYRKVPNLINNHSWMPLAFNPFAAVDEHIIEVNAGATLMSQNLLSNTEAFVSYGWNQSEGSLVKAGVRYFGLGVRFDFDASYGGNQMFYSIVARNDETGKLIYQKRPDPEKYYSVGLSATLPLYFQRGYHTRQLSVSAGWNYSNGMVADLGTVNWNPGGNITNIERIGFKEGLHKLSLGVGFSNTIRMAHRDFVPRLGYTASVSYTFNPSNANFSDLISLYGQAYLPGFAPHNSLILAMNYQTSLGGYKFPSGYAPLSYRSTRLIPHGFTSSDILANNYLAFSANYQLPVWYPEGGIGSVVYIKRVRLNVGADYAQFRDLGDVGMERQRIWAAGGDIIFDFNLFRQPASATSSLKLSVYHPSNGGVWVAASVGLPF